MRTAGPNPAQLLHLRECFAAGYFELPDASPMRRWSRAVQRRFEHRSLPPYTGTRLYPAGPAVAGVENRILAPNYSSTWSFSEAALNQRLAAADEQQRATLNALRDCMHEAVACVHGVHTAHTVGGGGYTHSIPNYGRIIREGLQEHERRSRRHLARAEQLGDSAKVDFYLALLDVIAGIGGWHRRLLELLEPDSGTTGQTGRRQQLIEAYRQVPFKPARSFFEAVVAYNFVFYLDDCDNPGRVDQELVPFYARDLAEGIISRDEALGLIRELWENADANGAWSAAIGGTAADGGPAYSGLTEICLEAARGMRRPNLQLHIRNDMPETCWDEALNTIATGTGLPALHNEEEFLRSLRHAHLGVREQDLGAYNGGGCTETMIHGCSNVGSLDAGINLPLILVGTLSRALAGAETFERLVEEYKADVRAVVREIAEQVNRNQESKALMRPQPMRSLLIDDCIDNGVEFNAGGARYNWSVINVAGLANVVDSLAAVQQVVFEDHELSGEQLQQILTQDFEEHEPVRQRLTRCPRYGNDDPKADRIAQEVADFVFREFLLYAPWRGGKYLASCLMFVTYAIAGKPVGATPDGRRAGQPLADSAGPVQGRDRLGPTAVIKSVGAIPHYLAPGTLVVNARFAKEMFTTAAGRGKLKSLIRTYFDLGGMQLQVNVIDQQVLRDAIAHPEEHEGLIVRVGGYSEYFNRLSQELKHTILERTEHRL